MKTISMKLPDDLDAELEARAERQGASKSSLVREALAEYLVDEEKTVRPASFLDQAADLAGCVDGPADLSVNPDHLDGYGR